jgi:hypothetical protein
LNDTNSLTFQSICQTNQRVYRQRSPSDLLK